MKRVIAVLAVLILLFVAGIWFFYFRGAKKGASGPKPQPIAVSKHSADFNQSADAVLQAYYGMTEAFVNWDTDEVNKSAEGLKKALDGLKIDDLQKDTIIYETAQSFLSVAKMETDNLLQQPSIDKKREVLNTLTDNIRTLFITVKYDQAKIYYQECPMAFNDTESGFWLSPTNKVRNPYLGTKHPKYKAGMLECGGPKDTINFIQNGK